MLYSAAVRVDCDQQFCGDCGMGCALGYHYGINHLHAGRDHSFAQPIATAGRDPDGNGLGAECGGDSGWKSDCGRTARARGETGRVVALAGFCGYSYVRVRRVLCGAVVACWAEEKSLSEGAELFSAFSSTQGGSLGNLVLLSSNESNELIISASDIIYIATPCASGVNGCRSILG